MGVKKRIHSKIIGFHLCNDSDFQKFYKIRKQDSEYFQELKQKKELYCLDDLDSEGNTYKKELYGKEGQAFSLLKVLLQIDTEADFDQIRT